MTLPVSVTATGAQAVSSLSASSGNAIIEGSMHGRTLSLRTCSYSAGAVCSLVWHGTEFVNDHDHGRQFQTAFQIDGQGEDNNPTEAGSESDGDNPSPSSSRLLQLQTNAQVNGQNWLGRDQVRPGNLLQAITQMAYWRPVAGQALSGYRLSRDIEISPAGLPDVIRWQVSIDQPDQRAQSISLEVLAGYMPYRFRHFYTVSLPAAGNNGLTRLADSLPAGEQPLPLIFATASGRHAIGVYGPEAGTSYGQFRFNNGWRNRTVKWSMVKRWNQNPPDPIVQTVYLTVGTLAQVQQTMQRLLATPMAQNESAQ